VVLAGTAPATERSVTYTPVIVTRRLRRPVMIRTPGTEEAHFTPCPGFRVHQCVLVGLLTTVTVNLYEV
jgi:hypothetical protein